MSTRDFSWGKGGWCVSLTTYHPCSAERHENPGPKPTRNPLGHLGMLRDDLYLYFHVNFYIPLVKQQFVLTHRYAVLQETEKLDQSAVDQTLKHVMFLQKYKNKKHCGHKTCWQNVFVTQLSSNAGISDELSGLQQIAISWFIVEHTFN
jgi:hypothetical protein